LLVDDSRHPPVEPYFHALRVESPRFNGAEDIGNERRDENV